MLRRPAASTVPDVVTLHVWGVPRAAVGIALTRMAIDRALLRREPATFTKLLGTGRGRTFTVTDADPCHWALLSTWSDNRYADDFEESRTARAWGRLSQERLAIRLKPLTSRGHWSRRTPFGSPSQPTDAGTGGDGPVASITRARIRPSKLRTFHRAVPPVSKALREAPGLRLAIGIGEAPIGLQGTFSLWQDGYALTDFAYRRNEHRDVIRQTGQEHWYAEELFARFQVLSVDGTYAGRAP